MKVDYLIVGFGLAGASFARILEKNKKRFLVIDSPLHTETRVIGGMYNPVILKRFTPAWKADEFWRQYSLPFYKEMEDHINTKLIHPFPVYRILHSIEEQNNWITASDKPILSNYMLPEIITHVPEGIHAPYGLGKLKHVGRVDGNTFILHYRKFLFDKGLYHKSKFNHNKIKRHKEALEYQGIKVRHIVFAEGSQLHHNPIFNYLPLTGTKGEMLHIRVPDLKNISLKSSVFLVSLGNREFMTGSTYNWEDKSPDPTLKGEEEIREKLERFLKLPYQIIQRKAGIRPTVKDRRPLIGKHPELHNLSVLNGLGTRGIIFAPALSEILFQHLENQKEIPDEMNIQRFENLYNIE